MEAVKIDTLPSTESNKLCSLLSTDARDSNDISKEKEEELLYGAGEDVDEDEALSDDSLRLQFSGDEEADQDDSGSSEQVYKPVKEEPTSEDEKFETSVTLNTKEDKLSCQESSAGQIKSVTEENTITCEEKCKEQDKLVDSVEESTNLVEGAYDQDTIMNGNDPRYFQSVIRPNFENRWRQNSSRPRMSFNNHHQHQRSYYQNSNFGPSEGDSMSSRYYNKQTHYGRSRGSGKPHHQNYNEHNNWNSKSRSLDRRKDSTNSSILKVIECSEKSEQETKDSTSKEVNMESITSDDNVTKSDIKIKAEEINAEGITVENFEKEKESLKDSPVDSKSLPVEPCLSEEAKVSITENKLMETDKEKNLQESANDEIKENSGEKNPEPTEVDEPANDEVKENSEPTVVDEPAPIDEYAHLNEETGVFAGTSTVLFANKNVEQSSNVEDSKNKETEVVHNDTIDGNNVPIPDDDPENCEEDQEDMVFETPTEDALPRKVVVSDSTVQHVPKISDVPIIMNEDSESAIENLPKVYQCLEEIACMEASRLAKEMEHAASVQKPDSTKELTENSKMNTSMTPEITTKDITENCNLDVSITSEKKVAMEEDNSVQNDAAAFKESEELKESELLNDDGDNSNQSMQSAETIIFGPPEPTKQHGNEVDKMDFDDNACQSNEDAKAADVNKETVLASEGANDVKMASISGPDLIIDEEGCPEASNDNEDKSEVSNDVSNDVDADVAKRVVEDDSNSGNSIFIQKKNVNSEEDLKKDTSHTTKVVNIEEEKMCVDDSECFNGKSDTSAEKRDVEATTISNDGCSNESQESSTSITMEVGDGHENKTGDDTSTVNPNKQPANAALPETTVIPETASTQGETSGKQKRKTAKNAEEIIRTKFLGNDSDVESDDSGKFVSVNYRSRNELQSLSPPSLKRNLTDEDDDPSEGAIVKKIKMTVDPSNHPITKFKEIKEEDNKVKESIRNLTNVRKFFQRDVKGQLKKLTQEELEELLIQKIVETITMSSEIGKLREQARLSEKNQEATRTRCQQLAKQIQDFEMVLKRNAADRSTGNDKYVAPIKINRSVGLQVNFISDHGMQNMRQMQQNVKSSLANTAIASVGEGTANPRRGIKVRSPRRSEGVTSTLMTTAVQSQAQTPTINPVTPAALVSTKVESNRLPMPVQTVNAQPVISSMSIRSPNKMGTLQVMQSTQQSQQTQQTQQTIILNGTIANRLPTSASLNVQKPKSNDLIDLTDEEEKTKTTVSSAPMTVTTATLIANSQNQRTLMQGHSAPQYQRLIQVPSNVALSNQATNIRVVQPNSQSTPAALVNNINAPRFTYVMQSGGGPPRQILIANPNSIRQVNANRNPFPALAYKTANGITSSANGTLRLLTTQATPSTLANKHPAPLPDPGVIESNPNWKLPPPAPSLKISKVASGIVLSWNMSLSDKHADIVSYQLFAYQEVSGTPPSTLLWKKVGDVMSLPLPMACTLTQFSAGNNYYFAVRAVDTHSRLGQYSIPGNISL